MPVAYLSRRYHFSASHRLHTDRYDAERNAAVYGKCNNPHGHGHNYVAQVTVRGEVDAVTGMVCDLGELDEFARRVILERLDGMNLNTLDCFAQAVSTTENLTTEIYRSFEGFGGARLEHVRVEETGNNSFDLARERDGAAGRF